MKQYTSPHIEIVSIQSKSSVIATSNEPINIYGGDYQYNAW